MPANVTFVVLGNVVYAVTQWAAVVVLAKLGAKEIVGQFALALALTAPIMLFSQLALRGVLVTDARREFPFGHYLAVRLIMTMAAVTVVSVVTPFLMSGEVVLVVAFVTIGKALDGLTDIVFGQWQREERLDVVAAVYAFNGVASLGALAGAVYLTGSATWAAAGFAAGSGLALCLAVIINPSVAPGVRLTPSWGDWGDILRLLKLAAPLGPVMLLVTLNANIPRYFVAMDLGHGELGVFVALSYVAVAGTLIVGAVGQVLSPRLARQYAEGDTARFVHSLVQFVAAAILVGAAAVLASLVAGKSILTIMYSSEYGGGAGVFVLVMTASAVGYVASSLGYAVTATRRFSEQLPRTAAVTAVTVVVCALLVPILGMSGAAWGCLAGALTDIAGSTWLIVSSLQRVGRPALRPVGVSD